MSLFRQNRNNVDFRAEVGPSQKGCLCFPLFSGEASHALNALMNVYQVVRIKHRLCLPDYEMGLCWSW